MNVSGPDPDAVRTVVENSPVHGALETLDAVFDRHGETVTLEVAETSYADLARGVDSLHRLDCYAPRDLDHYGRNLPGTFLSELPEGYDAYDLTRGDATLHLKFGKSHGEATPVGLPYRAVTVAVPTDKAYLATFRDAVRDRRNGEGERSVDGERRE